MNAEKKNGGRNWQIPVICLSAIIIVAMLCFRPGKNRKATLEEPLVEATAEVTPTAPQLEEPAMASTDTLATPEEDFNLLYGFNRTQYTVYEGDVQQGELLMNLLQPYTSLGNILDIAEKSKGVYDLASKMQINHHWAVFCNTDDMGESHLEHFVYEINSEDILVVTIKDGNVDVERKIKE
jgi:hypothetical protein